MRWNRSTCKSVCIPPSILIRPEDHIYNTAELTWGLFYALTHDCVFFQLSSNRWAVSSTYGQLVVAFWRPLFPGEPSVPNNEIWSVRCVSSPCLVCMELCLGSVCVRLCLGVVCRALSGQCVWSSVMAVCVELGILGTYHLTPRCVWRLQLGVEVS